MQPQLGIRKRFIRSLSGVDRCSLSSLSFLTTKFLIFLYFAAYEVEDLACLKYRLRVLYHFCQVLGEPGEVFPLWSFALWDAPFHCFQESILPFVQARLTSVSSRMLAMSISESSSLAFSKSARAYFQIVLGLQDFGLEGTGCI